MYRPSHKTITLPRETLSKSGTYTYESAQRVSERSEEGHNKSHEKSKSGQAHSGARFPSDSLSEEHEDKGVGEGDGQGGVSASSLSHAAPSRAALPQLLNSDPNL